MANTVYAAVPMCGFDLDHRSTTPMFALGQKVWLCGPADGQLVGIYVKDSGSGIAASPSDVSVNQAAAASDGSGAFKCTAAFAAAEYGWVYGDDTAGGT